jgi:hypothetical protein
MAHRHRSKTRAARRRAEKQRVNAAARERGEEAAEDAKTRPRNARHAAQLDVLLNRHVITVDQARAGNRFSRDFHLSGTVIGHLTSRYEPNLQKKPKKYSAPPPDTPHAIEARERFEQAIAALGPLSPITIHVAVCDLPASAWGANGKPNGDAVGILRLALSVLIVHYSKASSATGASAPRARLPHSFAPAPTALPAASVAASGPA